MAGIPTSNFRHFNANQFKGGFSGDTKTYFFIARSYPWEEDTSPPDAEDTAAHTSYTVWDDILAMKAVAASDVTFCVARHDWVSGTVYNYYDDQEPDLYSKKFYVLTSDFNVYVCIFNNNGGASTVMPTGTSTSVITTGDGYRWKYLYTITAAQALKFMAVSHIPVQTVAADDSSPQWAVQEAAVAGAVPQAIVSAGGSGYLSNSGTLQTAASSSATLATGASSTTNAYVNYNIYVVSGTGAGQLRKITAYNGSTKVATVSPSWSVVPNGSSTYIVTPAVVADGDGTGWSGYSEVSGGQLTKINTISEGQDYTRLDLTIAGDTGSGATARAILPPLGGHGADAVNALGGFKVMINTKLTGSEGGYISTDQEYRVSGLINDPLLSSDGSGATGTIYDMTTKFNITSPVGTFIKDETITGGTTGKSAIVVSANSSVLSVVSISGAFSNSETVTGETSTATATLSSQTAPLIEKGSGKMIYFENRLPVPRSASQVEDYKTIIAFTIALMVSASAWFVDMLHCSGCSSIL